MKTIVLSLAMTLFSVGMQSQTSEKVQVLDSVVIQNKYRQEEEKIIFQYDLYGNRISEIASKRETGRNSWTPYWKSDTQYNSNQQVHSVISYSYNASANRWEEAYKSETQWSDNYTIVVSWWWNKEKDEWMPTWKSDMQYRPDTRQLSFVMSQWENEFWLKTDKYESMHDADDNDIAAASYRWNDDAQGWENDFTSQFSYDTNQNLLVSVVYRQNNNHEATDIRYDGGQNPVSEHLYGWDAGQDDWIEQKKFEYQYPDNEHAVTVIESLWNGEQERWQEQEKTEYQYNSNDYPAIVSVYSWADGWVATAVSTYHYSNCADSLPSVSRTTVQIYPNPVADAFRVLGIQAGTKLLLLDMNGKLIKNQPVDDGEAVSVGGLQSGSYVVKLRSGQKNVVRKIIKE
ncbi:MAG: hypothetical protein EZS26_001335 [Candidatus Ordinivivax streblomastigis]|uniref:Secretion system C-terminal sorting domain-containing protein n=1 Tax=Candidatus Ordinivivax streblomastigis TaxID=2540710 RepID=A0A5M8P231_9BACT|nr:MAG: hypothetical protein EZS26_001335 [Candidatus Ordinivivax streblomastigis]